jgi:hypothetical protein
MAGERGGGGWRTRGDDLPVVVVLVLLPNPPKPELVLLLLFEPKPPKPPEPNDMLGEKSRRFVDWGRRRVESEVAR